MKIVDDIDALIGAAGKSLCRIHQQFDLAVMLLANIVHPVGVEEEIAFLFIHKPFCVLSFLFAPHVAEPTVRLLCTLSPTKVQCF